MEMAAEKHQEGELGLEVMYVVGPRTMQSRFLLWSLSFPARETKKRKKNRASRFCG